MRALFALAIASASVAFAADPSAPPLLDPASVVIARDLQAKLADDDTAWRLVESLSTEVGARVAGSEADAKAVAWAEREFGKLGFDSVSLEPVTFPVWRRGDIAIDVLGAHAQSLHGIALGWSKSTSTAGIEAEVVELADFAALEAIPAERIHGKLVYVAARMHKRANGGDYGDKVGVRSRGAEVAASKGALGLLIRSIGTDSTRFPHTGMGISMSAIVPGSAAERRAMVLKNGSKVALTAVPAAALSQADADQLSRLLKRDPQLRLRFKLQGRYLGEYTSHNVIGEWRGSERAHEIIVIGGHLDSWDVGTGAIDDAAGIGITAAALSAIAKQGTRPKRTIRVVAFANEEQGVWGGKTYAKLHAAELPNHVAAAESDFGAGRIYRIDANSDLATWPLIREIQTVIKPLGVDLGGIDASGGADLDEMRKAGVPMLTLQQDGTDYFDYHHTDNDTLDKIDPAALRQNVQVYASVIWLLADADMRLRARLPIAP